MKFKLSLLITFCILSFLAKAQDLLIYQPLKDASLKVYKSKNDLFNGKPLRFKQGEKIKIKIINSNPLFYKYEFKAEDQKDESEDKDIIDALAVLSTLLSSKMITKADGSIAPDPGFDTYKIKVNQLILDIQEAQKIVNESDVPESETDALNGIRINGGLRYAIDQIQGTALPGVVMRLPTGQYRFMSTTLKEDLAALLKSVNGLDDLLKESLTLLNNSLVQKVAEIKKQIDGAVSDIETEFVVTDKTSKIFLTIKPIDPKNDKLKRFVNAADTRTEIATVIPYYKRAALELVPVGNFLFAKDVKEFYLDNEIVQVRPRNKITFTPGVVLNVNVANFGESREMSAGIGAGYKLSGNSDALENFYFSALFSYKNFFRIGLGLGFAQYPYSLKNGVQPGQALPTDIDNLNDLIDYQEKFTGFLTIAFTGLNLSKKK